MWKKNATQSYNISSPSVAPRGSRIRRLCRPGVTLQGIRETVLDNVGFPEARDRLTFRQPVEVFAQGVHVGSTERSAGDIEPVMISKPSILMRVSSIIMTETIKNP